MSRDPDKKRPYRVQVHQAGETYFDRKVEASSSEFAMVDTREAIIKGVFTMPQGFDRGQPFVIEVSRRFNVVPKIVLHQDTSEST